MDNKDRQYIQDYLEEYRRILTATDLYASLVEFAELCRRVKASGNKLIFAGNGASASISSHAATDFTQHAGVRTVCFNDHNLITCFSNDYGYEKWVAEALKAYADPGDVVVLISSSGRSPNIVNAARYACENEYDVVTFSGFESENPLRSLGRINFWVESSRYNIVEATHLMWVLSVANLLEQDGAGLKFFSEYFEQQKRVLFEFDYSSELIQFRDLCLEVSARGGKLIFAGNGGSASIASHAATDYTKQSKIRTIAFNDHNLMSAYSNDYGLDHLYSRCIDDYADASDAIVLMSCSGQSKNLLNAARVSGKKGLPIVTFTGFNLDNDLYKQGAINFWVDSDLYSQVQATHSILIFMISDIL